MEVRPTAEPDLVLRVSFIVSCVEAPEWPAQGPLKKQDSDASTAKVWNSSHRGSRGRHG